MRAASLGLKSRASIARKTRVAVLGATLAAPVITRDTVAVETRARLATSRIPIVYLNGPLAKPFSPQYIEEFGLSANTSRSALSCNRRRANAVKINRLSRAVRPSSLQPKRTHVQPPLQPRLEYPRKSYPGVGVDQRFSNLCDNTMHSSMTPTSRRHRQLTT